MESVTIKKDGNTAVYRSIAAANKAIGRKKGFIEILRLNLGDQFVFKNMRITIHKRVNGVPRDKSKAFYEVFDRNKKKIPKIQPMKKDGKTMPEIIREIEIYNQKHGTRLTYGQYMARGLNYEKTTAP